MGDFSKPPLDVLQSNLDKGYVGLHIEEGVPILDRDLNLLNDLITATVRALITRYIGNGLEAGVTGFAIEAIPVDNNFRITGPGRCLVGGIEVTIADNLNYTVQAGFTPLTTPNATQPNPRQDSVFLDVWLDEVDDKTDGELRNSDDVGVRTSVRQKPAWLVRVAENAPMPTPAPGHAHYELARLARSRNQAQILAAMITDQRQTIRPLVEVEGRLRLLEQLVLVPTFDPSPDQFDPKFGTPIPPTSVTLFGKNFDVGTVAVRFGNTVATLNGAPSNTQIKAFVPLMSPGAVKITVQTSGGSVTSLDDFTVIVPAPTFATSPDQFEPKFGAAGTDVTLFGTNFNIGTVTVSFGNTPATIIGTPTATQIVARVPSMSLGAVKITVQTSGGSVTSLDDFTVI